MMKDIINSTALKIQYNKNLELLQIRNKDNPTGRKKAVDRVRQSRRVANKPRMVLIWFQLFIKEIQIKITISFHFFCQLEKMKKRLIVTSVEEEYLQKQVLWCHFMLVYLFGKMLGQFLSNLKCSNPFTWQFFHLLAT